MENMRSNLWKIVLCLFLLVTLIGCKQSVGKKNGNENGLAKENEASKMKTKDSDSENNTDLANEKEKYMNSKLNALTEVNYKFQEVSVHDPSIIEVNGMYYVFGSHLAGAKSEDFINWELLSSGVNKTNSIIPNTTKELEEALTWAQSDTLWAPDVIQLADGRFYMYYCACRGDAPISALGIAVADEVKGPYKDLGIILRSGMEADTRSENGDIYDSTVHPNVVDPCVFFDKANRLWMVYGSYSGGIYILELNPKTGFPLEKGYGKKLLGENHLRIEGPYIMYCKETDYYYMFLSYGGLDSKGGYNIRVSRSKNPDGPYYDGAKQDMTLCKGPAGSFFDDTTAAQYGTKILGNIHFNYIEGERGKLRNGYVSPGHNSAFYDEKTGRYFLIFHTRFENRGEEHQVRVHQMYLNEDDWFVVSPYRYVGESIGKYTKEDVAGPYKYINQMKDISSMMKKSTEIMLNEDCTISGRVTGIWELKNDNQIEITIKGEIYKGIVTKQWDEYGKKNVMVFTALSEKGTSILGSGIYAVPDNK